MELVLSLEHRFYKTKEGKYYASSQSVGYHLWNRYLSFFDKIIVVARVKTVDRNIDEKFLVSHPKVSFLEIPYYEGPLQYLRKRELIKNKIKKFILPGRAYLCRVPSRIGTIIIDNLIRQNIGYGVEVVADPWDAFSFKATKSIISQFLRVKGYLSLKYCVYNSNLSLFVTEKTLQNRYKPNKNSFSIGASDVIIDDDNFIKNTYLTTVHDVKKGVKLLAVGSLSQMYKAPDVILKAIKRLIDNGYSCNLIWLGDGRFMQPMIDLAKKMSIDEFVDFKGNVSASEVKRHMMESDLFIHVSKTEGLPRAVIEAISLGIPCIGSRVGGIPELIEDNMLVAPGSVKELYKKISYFIDNFDSIGFKISERNFCKSRYFQKNLLEKKRNLFYTKLKELYE